MRAGWLRKRVTIQEKRADRDPFGAERIIWVNVATVWAGVEPLRGREYLEAKQMQADVSTRIRMRYRSGVTPEMRVLYDGRTYEIESVIDVLERGRELNLMCREIVEL